MYSLKDKIETVSIEAGCVKFNELQKDKLPTYPQKIATTHRGDEEVSTMKLVIH